MPAVRPFGHLLPLALCLIVPGAVPAGEGKWIDLSRGFDVWKGPTRDWMFAGSVMLDPKDPKRLAAEPGMGILVNSPKGRARDLVTRQEFGDVEVHVEFLIPKGSNSGVKLEGQYEVQVLDSYGRKQLTGDDCGGIYPRAEQKPRYHHLDKGVAPRVNAARPAGEWQTLDIVFRAPRFDKQGRKVANARFVRVVLNGAVVQEDVEVKYPTGHAWHDQESPTGPLLLQGDHGPVAFRNVRIRVLAAARRAPSAAP